MNNALKLALTAALSILITSCEELGGSSDTGPVTGYETLQKKSPKRGVSFNFGQLPDADVPLLGPACSWSYNWGAGTSEQVFEYFKDYGMEYFPMAWNDNWNENTFRQFKAAHPECEYILAYNEPNLTDQANMTPAQAAACWPRLLAIAKELNMKIIAPAMNYGTLSGYHDPWKWYDEFFSQPGVSWNDVDGVALHCYMGSAQSMKDFVDKFKKYGKEIWLTEFCNWASNNISADAQMQYMVEAINLLEVDEQVVRYAWFIPRGNGDSQCHNNLLTRREPFELTDLGKVFVNMSTQDKSLWYEPGQVIPAEHYTGVSGALHLAPCTDEIGELEVRDLKKDVFVEYQLDLPKDKTYTIELRYYTYYESPLRLLLDGESLGLLELENTDYVWSTRSVEVPLPKGRHTLSITGTTAFPVTLNWLRINK